MIYFLMQSVLVQKKILVTGTFVPKCSGMRNMTKVEENARVTPKCSMSAC